MTEIYSVEHARQLARRRLPRMVYDYIEGGAGDEVTLRANRRAFQDVTFLQRVLVDVTHRDQGTTVLGEDISLPLLLAPVGMPRLLSREGELAAARAAGKAGTVYVLSTASSFSIEEVATVASGPLWFQLYLGRDREINGSLVQRAQKAGYKALCLSVDMPVMGKRDRDLLNGLTIPPRIRLRNILDTSLRLFWLRDFLFGRKITLSNFEGLAEGGSGLSFAAFVNEMLVNAGATWDEVTWLRNLWQGPLLVKGVLSGEDARRAVDYGVDGVVVSNHGGRQLDGLPSSIEMLSEVVKAVDDKAEVYLDGGVCRGSDVIKAKALGARACLVGRAYLWGLAVAGEAGVTGVLEVFRDEIDRTLALIGRKKFDEVDRSAVHVRGR